MARKKPHPPPTDEDRRFKDLLRKLVAVPKVEIDDKVAERKHRRRKRD
jgi:hypothetical protein